jgi:competence protein ComEC
VEFKRAGEPRKFDEFLYWKARGAPISVNTRKSGVIVTGREYGAPYVRYLLSGRIKTILPRRTAGYISAAWLGERDHDLTELHRNAGTSHILAVSGLHIGMAYAIFWFLLRRLKYRLYVISAVIWSYALLSGASPSALRAALMLQLVLAGKLLGESGCSFNGACVAAMVMLLWNPWIFWDVGWRMSMLSVMALTSLYSFDIGIGAKLFLSSPLLWLASSVQAAWTFGFVPLAGLVINFFAVPFFGVLLPAASVLSIPALAGARGGGGKYFVMPVEACFALWERFSNNITFLIPWKTDFSYPLLACGVLVMTYMFARACGFPGFRAKCAAGAGAVNIS